MYIIKKTNDFEYQDVSLREELKEFLQSNGIPVSALAEQLGIDRRYLERYISEGGDIKFAQAIKIMQVLGIEPAKFIQGFKNDLEGTSEEISDEPTKLSFLYSKFDIPSLKEIGLIKKRAKIDEIQEQICSFFGFQNITKIWLLLIRQIVFVFIRENFSFLVFKIYMNMTLLLYFLKLFLVDLLVISKNRNLPE